MTTRLVVYKHVNNDSDNDNDKDKDSGPMMYMTKKCNNNKQLPLPT